MENAALLLQHCFLMGRLKIWNKRFQRGTEAARSDIATAHGRQDNGCFLTSALNKATVRHVCLSVTWRWSADLWDHCTEVCTHKSCPPESSMWKSVFSARASTIRAEPECIKAGRPWAMVTVVPLSCGWHHYFHSTLNIKAPFKFCAQTSGGLHKPVSWLINPVLHLPEEEPDHLTLVHLSLLHPSSCHLFTAACSEEGDPRPPPWKVHQFMAGHTLPSITHSQLGAVQSLQPGGKTRRTCKHREESNPWPSSVDAGKWFSGGKRAIF